MAPHHADPAVVRINPSTWNHHFRYDQAQLRPAPTEIMTIAGQGSISPEGQLLHGGDTTAQLVRALDNVVSLLRSYDMTLRHVTRLVIFTTDLDGVLESYDRLTTALDEAGATPPCTLLGVARLVVPGMTVEIEATAGR